VDSSQWEISTQSSEMSRKLAEAGFCEN
jgi:hypothetical protein